MNTSHGFLIKFVPKHKRVIEEIGDIVVSELVFTLEQASVNDVNLVQINHEQLLPRTTSEYITTREAAEETGISKSELRELAKRGQIEYIRVQKTWLILRRSLHRYIEKNKSDAA